MRIIKTMKDIELLKKASNVKTEILEEIKSHFSNLYYNLGEGVILDEFSLVDSGNIVLLETGDNIADLQEIGLNPEDNGLVGSIPEFVEEEKLKSCTLITSCILCNNDYALSIFFEGGKFGDEVEKWIVENK